jgi:hypothetical protein
MAYVVNDTDAEGRPVTGLDLPTRRAEPGDYIDGPVPAWLVEQGYVTAAPKPRKRGA